MVETCALHSDRQLAKQMRYPSARVAAAHIDHPFAKDRRIDQSINPHCPPDRRPGVGELQQRGSRNGRHVATAQTLNAVIGETQERVLQIDELAWNME